MIKQGDSLELMKSVLDNSVDLVIADPPYYRIMLSDWNGIKHDWDNQWKNFSDYLTWISGIGKEIKRLLKNSGSFYLFADDRNSAYVRLEMEKIGFVLINEIVWVKTNNMTVRGWNQYRCFAPITERILFFGTVESEYEKLDSSLYSNVMNPVYEYLTAEKNKTGLTGDQINQLVGVASVAGRHYFSKSQWCFPTKERYDRMQLTFNAYLKGIGNVNEIAILTNLEIMGKLSGNTEVLRKDYEELRKDYEELRRYFKPEKNYTDVWISGITNSTDDQVHPTQKPRWLIERIILSSTKENGIVLDPFMGSGTTGVACKILGREFIGFELKKEYFEIVENRIAAEKTQRRLDYL